MAPTALRPPVLASLRATQEWFLAVTTHRGSLVDGLASEKHHVPPAELDRVIRPSSRQTAEQRLQIYHHGYTARLVECLADDYPAVRFALGEQVFGQMCHYYIDEHPSRGPNLNSFGRQFAAFLRTREETVGTFARELAELEWALVEVLHAQDAPSLDEAELHQVPAGRLAELRCVPSPAVRLFRFSYDVNPYMRAFLTDQAPELPRSRSGSPEFHVAVVRSGYTIRRIELSHPQAELLSRLLGGETLGTALGALDAPPTDIQTWFRDWTAFGVFSGFVDSGAG